MKEKIDQIFKDVTGAPLDVERAALIYSEIDGWDSVAHMALVAALEEEFDCMLDMDDILEMSNYDKVVQIMSKYV
jgi:acyl carrier protein